MKGMTADRARATFPFFQENYENRSSFMVLRMQLKSTFRGIVYVKYGSGQHALMYALSIIRTYGFVVDWTWTVVSSPSNLDYELITILCKTHVLLIPGRSSY